MYFFEITLVAGTAAAVLFLAHHARNNNSAAQKACESTRSARRTSHSVARTRAQGNTIDLQTSEDASNLVCATTIWARVQVALVIRAGLAGLALLLEQAPHHEQSSAVVLIGAQDLAELRGGLCRPILLIKRLSHLNMQRLLFQ